MTPPLREARHWIFDLDGTLTRAMHDFDAIRRELGLPDGRGILEEIAARPDAERRALLTRLDALEHELAREARPQPGARALLEHLRARGAHLAILTRNGESIAHATLAAVGLDGLFEPEAVLGRERCRPKPDPDGVYRHLERWTVHAAGVVVVGDYLFDLQAGRAAGTRTVYLDVDRAFPFREHADHCVADLAELRALTGET